MQLKEKILLGITMTLALLFGFLHTLWPDLPISAKRLHVFLFNLCTGGSLILYYAEGIAVLSKKVKLFFFLSLLYAISAAASLYIYTLLLSIPLFFIVESIRIKKFSVFPTGFFSTDSDTSEKFKQASLLCLSLAIIIASLVVINNEYMHWVSYPKLTIDVFFLGYSFPISLITMSIMFYFIKTVRRSAFLLKETSFWIINLGVISFFAFIIVEIFVPEILVASTLSVTVIVIFIMFLKNAPQVQQKSFLISGMAFLLFTALTGVVYILKYFMPALDEYKDAILLIHATVSLYGWNLSGLFIIIRWQDFPIELNSRFSIFLHWSIVMILVPIAKYYPLVSLLAMPAYLVLLAKVLFSNGNGQKPLTDL
jgi:hypothetical protein